MWRHYKLGFKNWTLKHNKSSSIVQSTLFILLSDRHKHANKSEGQTSSFKPHRIWDFKRQILIKPKKNCRKGEDGRRSRIKNSMCTIFVIFLAMAGMHPAEVNPKILLEMLIKSLSFSLNWDRSHLNWLDHRNGLCLSMSFIFLSLDLAPSDLTELCITPQCGSFEIPVVCSFKKAQVNV